MTDPYYADESVTLYLGDCLEIDAWLTADVLVTDPPYGIGYRSGGMRNTKRQRAAYAHTGERVSGDTSIEARDRTLLLWNGPAVVFGAWRQPRPPGVTHRLIWDKKGKPPGINNSPWYSTDEEIYLIGVGWVGSPPHGTVLTTTEVRQGATGYVATVGHPTPKPVGLMETLIERCPPGVIADPFAGSGSTLIAARNLGRKAIGVEIEERYCEIIARRLAQGVLL